MNDTIYYNGTVITMDGDRMAQAVLVADGRIAAVGSNTEVLARRGEGVRLVNLEGRTLLPAFIDPHSHFTSMASMLDKVPLADCSTPEEIAEALRRFKEEHRLGDDQPIVGFGYDHNNLPGYRHPTAADLDAGGLPNPIAIAHTSGHMGVVNSRMLGMLGYTAATPDPAGGKIGRNPDGSPNGYLEENAFMALAKTMVTGSAEETLRSFAQAQQEYARHGIATVQDGMTSEAGAALLERFGRSPECYLDIVGYADLTSATGIVGEDPYTYHGRYRTGGYKLFLDGSPQGRTAWMSRPYLGGDPDYCGYPIYTDEQASELMRIAVSRGKQLLVHCNGDAASEQFLRCYTAVKEELGSTADLRPVMVHCQTVRDDQLDRMAALPMIASFFVVHTYYWGDVHIRNFGEERGRHISPMRAAIDRGVVYTMHQDSPVVPPDMPLTIWAAVNRISKNGTDIGADQRITVMEALRGVTINAAYQYHEEQEKGSIQPGKRADLVILDHSPLAVPAAEIRNIRVLETIKDGVTIYKA
ncbi:MAG: amidohydrolase [Clostridiales bacterium]|nr:amidohydrolase [Clostridiales bacterium]